MYNFIVDHIPHTTKRKRRSGLNMNPEFITIHNTGNPKSTARNERAWLTNERNERVASFHYAVDEIEVIECIPPNEVAWHAGDGNGKGNRASIGIEICESGRYEQTLRNASKFVASLLWERRWEVDRLRRHFDWSGKVCPRLMYDNGKWTKWQEFIDMVRRHLEDFKTR